MKKYLYVFNYPPEDKELCALEFRTLFKDEFKSKYYLSNKDYSVDKSVFVKAKLDLWGIDADFNKLIEKVAALHKDYQNFKVIYLKNAGDFLTPRSWLAFHRKCMKNLQLPIISRFWKNLD